MDMGVPLGFRNGQPGLDCGWRLPGKRCAAHLNQTKSALTSRPTRAGRTLQGLGRLPVLKISSPIIYTDIFNIVALSAGHPVFKLEGWGDDNGNLDAIVIKQETGAGDNFNRRDVRVQTGLMTRVDRGSNSIVLKREEIEQLKMYADGGSVADSEGLKAANELKRQLGIQGVWIKMDLKHLVGMDSALKHRMQGDKTDVRLIAAALKKPGGLEKLGQIIAVDLFNGNKDRFIYSKAAGGKHPDLPERFKAISNLGNVLIALDGNGRGTPSGLDSYDPSNYHNDLRMPVGPNDDWAGMLLAKGWDQQRQTFAGNVIFDLEMVLGPRNRKIAFASKNRLGSNRKQRLLNGMLSGMKIIQRTLLPARNRPNFPVGLATRMSLLGW
jgi:hypothetical protein